MIDPELVRRRIAVRRTYRAWCEAVKDLGEYERFGQAPMAQHEVSTPDTCVWCGKHLKWPRALRAHCGVACKSAERREQMAIGRSA